MTLITTASDHVMNYKDWSYRNMREDNTVNGFSCLLQLALLNSAEKLLHTQLRSQIRQRLKQSNI